MSELTRRILFAVIAAPASIAIIYFGDWALAIVLAVLAALAAWELFRMARETGALPLEPAGEVGTGLRRGDVELWEVALVLCHGLPTGNESEPIYRQA